MKRDRKRQEVLFRVAAAILLAAQLVSCAGPRTVPPENIPARRPRPALNVAELEKEIHVLINQERQNHGLTRLSWNAALSRVARGHSRDMAKRNYFSHYSPEGRDFSYRYKQEGYTCGIQVKDTIYLGAENIFQNNLYDRVVYVGGTAHYDWNTMKRIAETTVQGWMNSPGHRKNILTPHWRSEGIGISIAPDDKVYITENFC